MVKYAVIGTGAAGGVLGGLLLKAGCEVHFLARSDFDQIRRHGLQVETAISKGQFQTIICKDVKVYKNVNDMPVCDVILLTVKNYNNAEILPTLRPILSSQSIIMLFQNGLNIAKSVANEYTNILLEIVSWIKASRVSAGNYRHDFGTLIQMSIYPNNKEPPIKSQKNTIENEIAKDFKNAGFTVELVKDLSSIQWTKLALNLPLFLLTIKHNLSSNQVIKHKKLKDELMILREEITKVAQTYNNLIDNQFIDKVYDQLKDARQPTYPSMKVDYDDKKPLEIESTFGNVVALANDKNLFIPHLKEAYEYLLKNSQTFTGVIQPSISL